MVKVLCKEVAVWPGDLDVRDPDDVVRTGLPAGEFPSELHIFRHKRGTFVVPVGEDNNALPWLVAGRPPASHIFQDYIREVCQDALNGNG